MFHRLKCFGIICIAVQCIALTQGNLYCYDDVKAECANHTYNPVCSTIFGNFPIVLPKFQQYANTFLERSQQMLMVATHFSNYQYNRAGFHAMFRDYSDILFDQFVSLMRYINNRGSTHDFSKYVRHDETKGNFELYELESLSYLTDVAKHMAQDALDLDLLVGGKDPNFHDADASFYLELNYARRQRRHLKRYAGYYVKLEKMLTSKNQMLVMYDFDGYLDKIYCDDDDD